MLPIEMMRTHRMRSEDVLPKSGSYLTASRRGQDKRDHHRSAAVSHNQLSWQHVTTMWQHVWDLWHLTTMLQTKTVCPDPVWKPVKSEVGGCAPEMRLLRLFRVPTSCTFMGSTRSGSYFEERNPSKRRRSPKHCDPKDASL